MWAPIRINLREKQVIFALKIIISITQKRDVGASLLSVASDAQVQHGVNLGTHEGHPYINLIKLGTDDFTLNLLKLIPMGRPYRKS